MLASNKDVEKNMFIYIKVSIILERFSIPSKYMSKIYISYYICTLYTYYNDTMNVLYVYVCVENASIMDLRYTTIASRNVNPFKPSMNILFCTNTFIEHSQSKCIEYNDPYTFIIYFVYIA